MNPDNLDLLISFRVDGVAQPRGSKTAAFNKATGRPFLRDDNPKSKPWMEQVTTAGGEAFRALGLTSLLDGPMLLSVKITLPRPTGHFGSGKNASRLKPGANAYPMGKPDLTKLIRGIEDAMNKVVIYDDSRIVAHQTTKEYGATAGVRISLYRLPATVAEMEAI